MLRLDKKKKKKKRLAGCNVRGALYLLRHTKLLTSQVFYDVTLMLRQNGLALVWRHRVFGHRLLMVLSRRNKVGLTLQRINTDMVTLRLKNTLKTTMRHCDFKLEEIGGYTWNIRRKKLCFMKSEITCHILTCSSGTCLQGISIFSSLK